MPSGDGTGPRGMGAMTGRAAGFCAGYGMPGYSNPAFGRGYGRGLGFGRGRGGWNRGFWGGFGWRNTAYGAGIPGWTQPAGYAVPFVRPDPEWEKQALKNQAEAMQSELEMIKKRLADIETGASEDRKA